MSIPEPPPEPPLELAVEMPEVAVKFSLRGCLTRCIQRILFVSKLERQSNLVEESDMTEIQSLFGEKYLKGYEPQQANP